MKEMPTAFKSSGKQLVGMLHIPDKKNPFPIIMCHGFAANKFGTWSRIFVHAARALAKEGYAVLRFDFNGNGDSEGRHEDQTFTSRLKDMDSAVLFLKAAGLRTDKIGLIGHSLGGPAAVIYASKNMTVKCVAAWSPLSDFMDLWYPAALREVNEKGFFIIDGYKFTRRMFLDEKKYGVAKSAAKLKAPLLVVAGEYDSVASPGHVKLLYRAARMPKKLVMVKSDHYFAHEYQVNELIRATVPWFKKYSR